MPPKTRAPARTPPASAGSSAPNTGSRAKKAAGGPDASWTLPALPDSILMRPPERWVCVHFKLQHINLLDDVVRLPPNATMNTLEARLIAHHGGAVRGIDLYKDDTQPKNRVRDFSKTLKEVFSLDDARPATVPYPNIPSASGTGPALILSPDDHHVTVCYDFKSHDSDCPLLNRSPRYRTGNAALDSLTGSTAGTATLGGGAGSGASPSSASGAGAGGGGGGGGGATISVGRSAGANTAASGAAGGQNPPSSNNNASGDSKSSITGEKSSISLSAPLQASGDGAAVGVGGGSARK